MVAKKAKSKRQAASTKYKIQKKVAEHGRKARKDAKKNPQRKALKKDPGIPNLFPFKEKLLHQAEEAKRKAIEEKELAVKARKANRNGLTSDQMSLAALAEDATSRSRAFDTTLVQIGSKGSLATERSDPALSGRKDDSRKAYYREFKKVIENADVILEVLDARDPLGCRTKQIEELILNAGSNKRIILILNKIDLVPRENVEKWLKYLRNEYPTVAFKASTQSQRSNLGQSTVSTQQASDGLLTSSECLGADNLIRLLKNYCRNINIKTSITVGIVGFPNVGKSSVINSLKRSKVCNVGAAPGITKVSQAIHLDKNIKLLDCPGIVFSRSNNEEDAAQVLLRNCVKVELLEDTLGPVELIVSRCKKEQLMSLYSVNHFVDATDFLVQLARNRGKLRKGGIPDIKGVSRSVIQDWNSGRIPFYTIPPEAGPAVESHISSAIVESWSKEFSLSEILELEDKEVLPNAQKTPIARSKMHTFSNTGPMPVDMLLDRLPKGYNDADDILSSEEMDLENQDSDSEETEDQMDDSEDEHSGDSMSDVEDTKMPEDKKIVPEIRFKPIQKKKTLSKLTDRSVDISQEEKRINPQTNKNLRKMQKQLKRNQRRNARDDNADDVEME
ncbi:hypothetical protein BDV3_003296 [Batrachochytrium dendrobatidis]|uniref:Ferrous iron transporter B n=1 Tax=Batrachochytrium dendrobatidis (strain JEL423) TaxID=403673 RepID=A0A177WK79_BATDL|nr:nuclear GTP-binding protein nug1 [Batrachochytrium dendrobatidis]KAK5670839.1 nuclear GTP-binding protein nug1 [Batrachochytrium dendrobatidis]OAJ40483.1 ferrous iron transporter B [Batrachochytrium dendrobatidis JEL423]